VPDDEYTPTDGDSEQVWGDDDTPPQQVPEQY